MTTFQAEDEIAAVGAAIGASFGGALGVTGTSGPGFALKQEAIGLAVPVELPLVVVNVQRAGPSTGMPTKTEQADLLQAIVGRNGECPIAVVAPATPAECFDIAIEAVRLAVEHMCPVAYLSDGSLANGAEPWQLPDARGPRADPRRASAPIRRTSRRSCATSAWCAPGRSPARPASSTASAGSRRKTSPGNISYDPENHEHMVAHAPGEDRQDRRPPAAGADRRARDAGDVLIVGWGGTYGALRQAALQLRARGRTPSATCTCAT